MESELQGNLRDRVSLDGEHNVENELHVVLVEAMDEQVFRRRSIVVDCVRAAEETGRNEAMANRHTGSE